MRGEYLLEGIRYTQVYTQEYAQKFSEIQITHNIKSKRKEYS